MELCPYVGGSGYIVSSYVNRAGLHGSTREYRAGPHGEFPLYYVSSIRVSYRVPVTRHTVYKGGVGGGAETGNIPVGVLDK